MSKGSHSKLKPPKHEIVLSNEAGKVIDRDSSTYSISVATRQQQAQSASSIIRHIVKNNSCSQLAKKA